MTATLISEWTKLRTQRGTLIALLVMVLLMVGFTAFGASQTHTDAVGVAGDDDIVQNGLSGILFGQIAAIVVGASLVTAEFSTRMIRTTFIATQSRFRVLAAKAIILGAVTFPLALISSAIAFVIAQSLLRDRGFVAPAYPAASLTDGPVVRAVAGTALLLTLYALIALGLGTVLRHSGATIATGIALLFVPIVMLNIFPDRIKTRIEQTAPLAGMAIQSTTGRMLAVFGGPSETRVTITRDGRQTVSHGDMPIAPWAGLGVTAAWALASLGLGYTLLRSRDT